jgi:hypothetical protein
MRLGPMASELRINVLCFILAFSLTLTLPCAHLCPTLISLDYSFFSYFQQFYSLLASCRHCISTMVSTRNTPSRRITAMLDHSHGLEVVRDESEEDVTDITDQLSVSFLLDYVFHILISQISRSSIPPNSDDTATRLYASPYQSTSAVTPSSSSASPKKKPATPPPVSDLNRVPNIQYFRGQWVYVENLDRLDQKLSWEAVGGSTIKWLAYNDLDDLYSDEEPGPLGVILLGQLGPFIRLRSAENHFNKNKPEFSLQLEIDQRSLGILNNLICRRERNLNVTNPLRVKVTESDITSSSFTPGDPFPATFDGTSTDDDQDGDIIDASCFTAGDKVAIQAWFGSYIFTDKSGKTASGPTFRLLKLWRLQAGISALSSVNNSPITKRKRLF